MSRLLIQLSHISHSFGSFPLFEELSLSIHEGDVFALIGENGAGKTTLLRLLLNKADAITVGYLPQQVNPPAMLVREYLESGELTGIAKQMAACLEDPARLSEWAELHEEYEKKGGYRTLPLEKVLQGLKVDSALLNNPLEHLSSGQKVRIALAKALAHNPDLLLLDEPTNHLDAEMLTWLEQIIRERKGATVIVSHDRTFLNATCNHLIELRDGSLTCYGGNYDFYLAERERLLEKRMKAYEMEQEEKKGLKQKIKAMTFAKGKPRPPSDRNIMAYDYRGGNHQKSEERKLDDLKKRLTEIEAHPLSHPKPKSILGLRFTPQPLASTVAIELRDIAYQGLFAEVTKTVSKGDRIVITGSNGVGKTTLLRCIAGLIPIYAGEIRIAPTGKIGYLDQEVELLPMDQTPLEYFRERFQLTEEALRSELHKAALGGAELIGRNFSTMSAGQRKRLMLLSLILEKPNILLLDEPTNHLDFLTLEALEKALLTFDGALVVVSHDATFIEKIATEVWEWSVL